MRFSLNIDCSAEKMEASRKRMEARAALRYVDRVPVGFCLVPRYFTPEFDLPYSAIFASAEEQYYWQLQFLKRRIETIPEDLVCTTTTLTVAPYFDNVLDSAAFGADIVWPEDETPQSRPTVTTVDEMTRYTAPVPGSGLWGKARDWWLEMRELARDTHVTFNALEGRVEVGHLGISGLSPHMIAIDLVGHDFYWWQVEYPDACREFLAKITSGLIEAQRYFMAVDDRPRGGFGLAEDTAQIMSAEMFRDFCVPYAAELFDTFGKGLRHGRGMHMCGDSTHLHQVLVDDLRISSFDLFGCLVEPEAAAKNLGGRMYLWGNIDPVLMLKGTREQVKQTALAALTAMAPCGGLMLGDGANVCPGTPRENLAALTEACEEFGVPQAREGD